MAAPSTHVAGEPTRKRSCYGLSVWRLPERPKRSGMYYNARPHYALAPMHWTAAHVAADGLVYLTYEDALIGLGRVASYLTCARQEQAPARGLYEYVARQASFGLRMPDDWREGTAKQT